MELGEAMERRENREQRNQLKMQLLEEKNNIEERIRQVNAALKRIEDEEKSE